MKLTISVNAVVFIALGILFTLYSPVPLAVLGIPDSDQLNGVDYWNIAAFSRMFGAALFSTGILLWAVRSIFQNVSEIGTRGLLYSLILGNILLFVTALTQTFSAWQNPAGFILAGIPLIFIFLYLYWIIMLSNKQ